MMPTVQYTATINGASVSPAWTIDRGELGAIDVASGLFTAAGTLGGTATITAKIGGQIGDDDDHHQAAADAERRSGAIPRRRRAPGGYGGVGGAGPAPGASTGQTGVLMGTPILDAQREDALSVRRHRVAARPARAAVAVEPGRRATFDAVLIKLHSKNFDYTGTFAKNTTTTPFINMPIPQDVWHTLAYSNEGKGDDITRHARVRGRDAAHRRRSAPTR